MEAITKKRMLSGIKPTGRLTLGNYIGAIKQFISYQDEYEMYIFIADLHALTLPIDAKELRQNTKDLISIYLACGLDPNKVVLFKQSDVHAILYDNENEFVAYGSPTWVKLKKCTHSIISYNKEKHAVSKQDLVLSDDYKRLIAYAADEDNYFVAYSRYPKSTVFEYSTAFIPKKCGANYQPLFG